MSEPGSDQNTDAEVSRRYRQIAGDQPPADLDAAILAAARREVGAGPRKRMHAWHLPLSLAAVVVLSVSLVTLMNERDDAEIGAEKEKPRAPASAAPDSAVTPSQEPAITDDAASGKRDSAAERRALPSPSPPAARPLPAEPFPAPKAREPAAIEGERSATPDRERRSRFETEEQGGQARENATAKSTPEAALPPAEWLARISELRRSGKLVEADRSLAKFRRRYPDYPLPEALR